MHLNQAALQTIVDRASTLTERLGAEFRPVAPDIMQARRRLAHWKHLASMHDPLSSGDGGLRKNLGDWPAERLLVLLGCVERSPLASLPSWADTLLDISQTISRAFAGETTCSLPILLEHAVPFAHLYWPVCEQAWRNTGSECFGNARFSSAARLSLQRLLLRNISQVVSFALQIGFQVEVACFQTGVFSSPWRAHPQGFDGRGNSLYTRFVREEGRLGMTRTFTRYPVAARLVAQTVERWQTFVGEFLRHLENDLELLAARFNAGRDLGRVRSIRAGVSDPHSGGRSVMILTFERGRRLVYKPRSLEVDARFFELVRALNEGMGHDHLRVLEVLNRGGYGWMEYARPSSCADNAAAKRYARRAGALTCLAYWLHATDCHRHNVVAAGEHPVLVDLEALAHPLPGGRDSVGTGVSLPAVGDCVLRTCLLPLREFWGGVPAGQDHSGLCAPKALLQPTRSLRWEQVNTNAMRPAYTRSVERHASHKLRAGGKYVDLRHLEAEVLSGYRKTALLLTGSMSQLFQQWAKSIWCARRRRIKRPTLLYRTLLLRSLRPECLTDGVDRSLELEVLPCGVGDEQEWAKETAEMESLDIPYFNSEGKAGTTIPFLPDRRDLLAQEEIIRLSLRREIVLRKGKLCLAQHESTTAAAV